MTVLAPLVTIVDVLNAFNGAIQFHCEEELHLYFVRFVLFCADAVNDFLAKNCPYIAGAISFYTLFSSFPLALAIISVAGYVLPGHEDEFIARQQLVKDIGEVIPVSTSFIADTLQGVVNTRAITGIASILGLLWASTAAFSAIRKGINAAWGIKKTRPFLKERLIDLALVVGAGVLVVLILFAASIFGFFSEITSVLIPDVNISKSFWGIAAKIITAVLSFLTFLILYRFLPNTRVSLNDVWLGSLLASMAFEGAKWGFVWYVTTFPIYNVVYGSVGAIMALLTWVYVSAIILLFGALITSRYTAFAGKTGEKNSFKLLWIGLSRVRLRVVPYTDAD